MSIESISLKFKSGNPVQVSEAKVTRAEWESVIDERNELKAEAEVYKLCSEHLNVIKKAADEDVRNLTTKCKELQARVAELEVENIGLRRKVDALVPQLISVADSIDINYAPVVVFEMIEGQSNG